VVHGGEERLAAVLGHQLLEAARADADSGDARPHVALQEVGQTRVDLHDAHHGVHRHALVDELDRREAQALLEDLACVGRDRPRHHAADVVPVRDVRRPRHELALREHRHREDDVVEVGNAAVVRVVGGEDVALADVVAWVEFEDPPDGLVEHADEGRDPGAARRQLASGVRDAGPHVEDLVDDRAHRRPPHGGEHLVAARLQAGLDDLQRDRVESGRGVAHAVISRSMRRFP
jgi:hypothetical protein